MSKPATEIFVQVPGTGRRRILHAGRLLAVGPDRYHGDFSDGDELVPDAKLLICYERDSCFVKEPVRIVAVDHVAERVLVELEILGDSTSAEHRESRRIWIERQNLLSRFGGEEGCPVVDISESGFAVYAIREHAIGELIDTALYHEGEELSGIVSIRNAREVEQGRMRYGVYCLDGVAGGRRLARALPRLNIEMQREIWKQRRVV